MFPYWPLISGRLVVVSPLLRNWSRSLELLNGCTLPSARSTLPLFWCILPGVQAGVIALALKFVSG
jgi:hypothetical protein